MTVGVHWLRAVTFHDVDVVLEALTRALGCDVEVREGGRHFYDTTYVLGPVQVWSHSLKPDMGVCVEVSGTACEALGAEGLLALWRAGPEWRVSRVDVAVDQCPGALKQLRDEWRAGNVNTRVKALAERAQEGREDWRRHEWVERPDGDLFGMGSRSSMQYARCYNTRGFTRFELELKGDTGAAAAPQVMEALAAGTLGELALGLIQRFVSFVDRGADSNASRCPLLPFWSSFTRGVARARLWLGDRVVRTLQEVEAWARRQVAPSLALLVEVLGLGEVQSLAAAGRTRWRRRHRDTLALALGRYAADGAAA